MTDSPKDLISYGATADVYRVRRGGRLYAVKVVRHDDVDTNEEGERFHVHSVGTEIRILQTLPHPNLVRLYHVVHEEEATSLWLEYVEGGDLHGRRLSLQQQQMVIRGVARALQWLHAHRVVHRDIKSENVLFDEARGIVKLCDMGLSFDADDLQLSLCGAGTPLCCAPEILLGERATYASDMWGLGILLYEMATGSHPFDKKENAGWQRDLLTGTYRWKRRPFSCRPLVDALLRVKPADRLSATDVLNHAWLRSTRRSPRQQSLPAADEDPTHGATPDGASRDDAKTKIQATE